MIKTEIKIMLMIFNNSDRICKEYKWKNRIIVSYQRKPNTVINNEQFCCSIILPYHHKSNINIYKSII